MHQWLGELEQIDGRAGKIDLNILFLKVSTAFDEATNLSKLFPWRFRSMADLTTWAAMMLLYPAMANAHIIQQYLAEQGDEPQETICSIYPHVIELILTASTR